MRDSAAREMRFTIVVPSSRLGGRKGVERERRAIGRVVSTVQELLSHVPADRLADALARAGDALAEPNVDEIGSQLALELADGRTYSPQERWAIEVDAQLRAFQFRRELLADALTATQVAELLGTSRQTPHDRVRSGSLLAVLDRGQLRFPRWQFDPRGPDGVVAGLPSVIRALEVSPLAKVSWLTRPNPYLEERTPLEALRDGDLERVLDVARAVSTT